MQINSGRPRVVAVLGPTNTGKTYLALERMLGHDSGIMGFPLRLLARENYDRAVKIKGVRQVALITGEEKIVPPYAKYFFCTVESMPSGIPAAFVGVDEVQLAADPDRGHVFTDRILRARGDQETMFMGSDTIRARLRELVPGIEFQTRSRFSTLRYAGPRKINRLPRRSAVVAFTANDVYAIAELIRRQRGGAAIVMGALSPRTRNAQVALFQSGDVDYLVATDAIGMGLNMDIDHVAFASLTKFDGRVSRALRADELAQIAGRAGRHMNDGTFGTTADAGEIQPDIIDRIENHKFDSIKAIHWRNAALVFDDLPALERSLAVEPQRSGLVRVRPAPDELALAELIRAPDIRRLADRPETVRLLWDVCQVPDFQKMASDTHVNLLGQIYRHLMTPAGKLPTDWVARHVAQIDKTDGDIETLLGRISKIRIWTYVSHRGDWLTDPDEWQGRTRDIEDRLSDALHERLTQRFVDQRTALLVRRLKDRDNLSAQVEKSGDVMVEGHYVGRLDGFRFIADQTDSELAGRAVTNAALKALGQEIRRRVNALAVAGADELDIADDGALVWQGSMVARLAAGADILRPQVVLPRNGLLEADMRQRIERHLDAWMQRRIDADLAPLRALEQAELSGAVRGIAFRLGENLGKIRRHVVDEQLSRVEAADRARLRKLGVRIGRDMIYMPALLKPKAARLSALLWMVHRGQRKMPEMPPAGRMSIRIDKGADFRFLETVGYRACGPLAIRIDILERLLSHVWKTAPKTGAAIEPAILNLVGCSEDDLANVLTSLGFRREKSDSGDVFKPGRRKKQNPGQKRRGKESDNADSPFAKLQSILAAE